MQAKQTPVIITVVVCTIVLGLLMWYFFTTIPDPEEVVVDVPTAEEIAAAIEIPEQDFPDTILSVRDEKKQIALELAVEELGNKEVMRDIANSINWNCPHSDVTRWDITDVQVRDEEFLVRGKMVIVRLELKVFYDNYGDDDEPETARINVVAKVRGLDRDEDYRKAEAEVVIVHTAYSCSTR